MSAITKTERLDFRVPADMKEKIERAATIRGQTVSGFVLGVVDTQAREVIREADETILSNRDRDRFLALLDDIDAEPNAALLRAARRYQTEVV